MITTPVKIWRRQKKTASLIGKKGVIAHHTIVRIPPPTFEKEAPYPVVIVELDNKERMVGQLVDWKPEDLVRGRKVIAVLRRSPAKDPESVIPYTIKFRPAN